MDFCEPEVVSCTMKGHLDLVALHQNLSLPAAAQSLSLNFNDSRMQDDSLLGCSLSSIEVSQESTSDRQTCCCRHKSTDKRIQQLEHENTELRSLLEQLLTETKHQMEEMNRHQIEIECLREQRAMLLEGPLHKFPNGQRLKDCFGEELETIGLEEHEPLRMFIVNGRFRFEEMRKWKRYGEKDRKSSVRRYHM